MRSWRAVWCTWGRCRWTGPAPPGTTAATCATSRCCARWTTSPSLQVCLHVVLHRGGRIVTTQVQPQEHVMCTMNHAAQASNTSCYCSGLPACLYTHLLAKPVYHAILMHDFLDEGKHIQSGSLPDLHRRRPVFMWDSTSYQTHRTGMDSLHCCSGNLHKVCEHQPQYLPTDRLV